MVSFYSFPFVFASLFYKKLHNIFPDILFIFVAKPLYHQYDSNMFLFFHFM